jgi:hypothetical protein
MYKNTGANPQDNQSSNTSSASNATEKDKEVTDVDFEEVK